MDSEIIAKINNGEEIDNIEKIFGEFSDEEEKEPESEEEFEGYVEEEEPIEPEVIREPEIIEDEDLREEEIIERRRFPRKVIKQDRKPIDFSKLDENEKYLPLSYIIDNYNQWDIILKACRSNFNIVNNMAKVSDSILLKLILLCTYAVENDINPELNNYFIDYALQRNVKI